MGAAFLLRDYHLNEEVTWFTMILGFTLRENWCSCR